MGLFMFEFYLPDAFDNLPFWIQTMVQMASVIIVSIVAILIIDYFQWPKWLAQAEEKNPNQP